MSEFLDKLHRFAASISPKKPTAQEAREIELGRVLACQFVDALRAGDKTQDGLMLAIGLVGGAGGETLRGFLREIHESLLEGRP